MTASRRWGGRTLVALAASLLIGVLFIYGGPPASAAGTDWSPQKSGTTVGLHDVSFASDTLGIAVGNSGKILRTEDGGTTWTAATSGTTADLFAATVTNGSDAICGTGTQNCFWAAGAGGTILFSNDEGKTWCPQTSGVTATIYDLDSSGPNDVFAVGSGGTFIRNGSAARQCGAAGTYTKGTSGTDKDLFGVALVPDGSIVAVGTAGTIVRQTGASTLGPVTSGTTNNLYEVHGNCAGTSTCTSPEDIVAVGAAGTVVYSTDGTTWKAGDSGSKYALHGVWMTLDNKNGYAVGDLGTVLHTSDGGATWAAEASGTCANLDNTDFVVNAAGDTVTHRWAIGDNGTIITDKADANATQPNCTNPQTGTSGYRMVAGDGGVFVFGNRSFNGSMGGKPLNKPIVGGATDLSDFGSYWLVASDGGVFAFGPQGLGTGPYYGSIPGNGTPPDSPITEIEPTPTGKGYYLVSAKGKVYPFGDAKNVGDLTTKNITPNGSIIGMTVTPSGAGYWLVGSDGGIYTFGDAGFFGSTGAMKLNAPVVDLGTTPDGNGYYLVAKDGGVFTYGDAVFRGSTGSMKLNQPVVSILVATNGAGYWLGATDGGVFTFGPGIPFLGSTGNIKLNSPVNDFIY